MKIIHKGVRTESWTAGRSGLEVRMYSREKVELFLLATEDGMGPTAAADVFRQVKIDKYVCRISTPSC